MSEPDEGKIVCKIDGALTHSVQLHIRKNHPNWMIPGKVKHPQTGVIEDGLVPDMERYQREFPGAPVLSKQAADGLRRKKALSATEAVAMSGGLKPVAEAFDLPAKLLMNAQGKPIMVQVEDRSALPEEDAALIPDVDPNYVFNIELLKIAIIAIQLNIPALFWGLHGSGKTTIWEQVCARTNRPMLRIQHTINTEESHVLGQWTVKDGATEFNLGPLPIAMMRGLPYLADEYDFALPSITSVYQPVLEGKALVIKEAPPEYRVIRPHANFRFMATGNTNGIGDETGLYQGTQIQNAANYSRFGITEEVHYPEPKIEQAIIVGQARYNGHALCKTEEAEKLVKFATEFRKQFKAGQVSSTVSPRELIRAATLAGVRGGDYRGGLRLAFMNRLSRTDKEVAEQFAQRIFGGAAA